MNIIKPAAFDAGWPTSLIYFLKETERVSETKTYTGGPGGGSSGSRGCTGIAYTKPPLKPRDQVSKFT